MSGNYDTMTEEEIDEDLDRVARSYKEWMGEFESGDQDRLERLRTLWMERRQLVDLATRKRVLMTELAGELGAALANRRRPGWLRDALAVVSEAE